MRKHSTPRATTTPRDRIVFDLPAGAGKYGPTISGHLAGYSASRRKIAALAITTREEIERRDIRRHMRFFHPAAEGVDITPLHGQIVMLVRGYDADPREIYEIPEIRRYWAKAQLHCPTLFFYGAKAHPHALRAIIACIAPAVDVVRFKGRDSLRIGIKLRCIASAITAERVVFLAMHAALGLNQETTHRLWRRALNTFLLEGG